MLPKGVGAGKHIRAEKKATRAAFSPSPRQVESTRPAKKKVPGRKSGEKAYTVVEKRRATKEAYQPWNMELDKELIAMADTGASVGDMAEHFGRTKGAVYARLKKLDYFS